ncbi:MAG: efflux RND transporter periplasmic adaptor subunit [bacterium]
MKKKFLFIIGGVVIIIIVIILNLVQGDKGKEVEVKIIGKGDIISEVTASGELRAKAQVDISSETIGRIKKIYFQEGDHVKKGTLLIELNDVQVKASKKLAQAQLNQAEQDLVRAEKLFEKDLISKESYEKILLSYEATRAQYEQALDAYKKTQIYAPISGKIMKINVEEGETAVMGTMNYQGTVLMTIADMSMMIAVVTIDETDVPTVSVGQEVEVIADALPDSTYFGKVTKVGLMPITSQLTTEKVTDFEVEIELDKFSPLLRPGMNVKTEIITNEKSDVLIVPIQASGKRKIEGKTAETVFKVEGSNAVLREIITGASSDTDIEIISGVEQGDTVIIGPYRVLSKLKDGQQVQFKIEEEDTSSSESPQSSVAPRRVLRAIKKRI